MDVTKGCFTGSNIFRGPDGHSYYFNREMAGGRLSLECVHRKTKGKWCKGRVSCNKFGEEFRVTTAHSCPHDNLHFHKQKFRHNLLQRCAQGDFELSHRAIYNQERRAFP